MGERTGTEHALITPLRLVIVIVAAEHNPFRFVMALSSRNDFIIQLVCPSSSPGVQKTCNKSPP